MAVAIKPTQLTRVGYEYQDLLGLQLLIDWYCNPKKYEWVKFEVPNSDGLEVAGLDDVVACRSDGTWVLLQSKYTIDPERGDLALSFDWLLEKKSRLEKWSKTLLSLLNDGITVDASLKTNRKPDSELYAVLENGLLQPDKMDEPTYAKLRATIGSDSDVKTFCENFKLDHSLQVVTDLEEKLYLDLVAQGKTEEQWLRLAQEARRWSYIRDFPKPDGTVRIRHLRYILDSGKSRQIPQGFGIPEGYIPPDSGFHDHTIRQIKSDGLSVIWGTPGIGKSTYLSFLCNQLESDKSPVVRHHYYLSQTDETSGRWWFDTAAGSLVHQLSFWFPDEVDPNRTGPGDLRTAMETCAERCAGEGKTLTVIVDGLDHVWREQSDTRQLIQLFDQLLPLPIGVHLVVGTQMVADEHLPASLLAAAPKEQWTEMPQMNLSAINAWLSAQELDGKTVGEIDEISQSFQRVSNGHPLYLVYSFEYLQRNAEFISSYEVENLPPCPDNNINNYYDLLWQRLPVAAREILHLCACSEFHWPDENSIYEALGGDIAYVEAFIEIGHLLRMGKSRLIPFHGSIMVYIRNRSDHDAASKRLTPVISRWLVEKAPPFWQWGWQWLTAHKLGNSDPLIDGPSRDWVVDAWMNGYPNSQLISIMESAEEAALRSNRYDRLVALRLLKVRIQNAPDFQGQSFGDFRECALSIAPDTTGADLLCDNIREIAEDDRVMLSRLMVGKRPEIADECFDEQNKFVSEVSRLKRLRNDDYIHSLETLVRLAALAPGAPADKLVRFASQFGDEGGRLIRAYLLECMASGLASKCLAIEFNGHTYSDRNGKDHPVHPEVVYEFGTGLVRIACSIDAKIEKRAELGWIRQTPLGRCFFALKGVSSATSEETIAIATPDEIGFSGYVGPFLHNHFFSVLAEAIEIGDAYLPPAISNVEDKHKHHIPILELLSSAAKVFSARLRSQAGRVDTIAFYEFLEQRLERHGRGDYKVEESKRALLASLSDIAFDLAYLGKTAHFSVAIDSNDVDRMRAAFWCSWGTWTDHFIRVNWQDISSDAVRHLIDTHSTEFEEDREYFSELADNYVLLARLALHNEQSDIAIQMLQKAARCYLGYGWRRDTTIFDVLESINHCAQHGVDVIPWLQRVEPVVLSILEITDGKDTNHAPELYLNILSNVCPGRLPLLYAHYQRDQSWHYAKTAFENFVEVADLSIPTVRSAVETDLSDNTLRIIRTRADSGDTHARDLYEEQLKFFSVEPGPAEKYEGTHPTIDIDVDYSSFPPEAYDEFLKFLEDRSSEAFKNNNSIDTRKYAQAWFRHWRDQGRSSELLSLASPWLEDERATTDLEVGGCLGEVFEISLEIEGKDAAYKWMLLDHQRDHGWRTNWSERAEERTKRAAGIYADRWHQFILDTSIRSDPFWALRYGLSVGLELLVLFLLEINQTDLAVAVTERMVSSVEEDVSPLDLISLIWESEDTIH